MSKRFFETSNGIKGGMLKGKAHYDSEGNSLGGIKAVVTDQGGTPVELEGNEVIINKKTVQSDKVLTIKGTPKEILSTLNQMDGNGVAIGDEDAEILAKYRQGGEIPEQGTLYTKNRKTKLEYTKNGSDYVFSIFEAEENPVEGYKRNQYKKHDKNKATMNYNQFVNYLYAESFLHDKFAIGGSIGDMTPSELKAFYNTPEGKKLDAETYAEWKSLVNMSKSEITNFYNSPEGKQAGLSESEAKEQGIDSGRESARWIMKMKDIPYKLWSSDMWRWAKKQISFIKRMSGMRGDLYDDKGRKTRKHTALLIWGHKPTKKFEGGGEVISGVEIPKEIDELFKEKYKLEYYYNLYGTILNSFPKNELGLTTESDRATKEYKDVKQKYDLAKRKSDNFNTSKEGKELIKFQSKIRDRMSRMEISKHYKDLAKELSKGTAHEMEHLATLKKVAEGKVTPEEGVVETAKTHIKENPEYYEDLAKMEAKNKDILKPFKDIVLESKSFDEAFDKVSDMKGVPREVSAFFFEKYNPNNKLDKHDTFLKFYTEVKGEQLTEESENENKSILETQVRGLELLVPMLEGEQKNIIEKQIRGLKLLINIV